MSSKTISKEALILKKIRELKLMSRSQAAILMGTTHKNIEKMENGRCDMTHKRVQSYLTAYNISQQEFELCLDGKIHLIEEKYASHKPKVIEHKALRRSYQKIITKDVKILIGMRRLKGYSQSKASHVCGYSRSSMGHIESGRIELRQNRIAHIVKSYGFTMEDFNKQKSSDFFIKDTQDECVNILKKLNPDSLKMAHTLLQTIKQK